MARNAGIRLLLALALLAGEAAVAQQPSTGGYVRISCDQADVRSFVKLVGEVTGKRIIVDQNVEGKITVISPSIPGSEVYRVFSSILESAGCSVVEEQDGVCRVVAIAVRTTVSAPVIGPDDGLPGQGIVTKVFRLQYASAVEVRKVLESKVRGGREGAIGAVESTNYLIVTDAAENIRRMERIIAEIDKPGLTRVTEIVALKYAGAEDMAAQLSRAMAGGDDRARRARSSGPVGSSGAGDGQRESATVVAAPHSNSLIIVGDLAQIQELKRIISLMDVDSPSGAGRFRAIFLKYISAEDAAKSLNALLSRKSPKEGTGPQNTGGIMIEPHAVNNALLVDAMPRDFELVSDMVRQLDIMPEQVLIEVLIAEVSLKNDFSFGIDVVAANTPSAVGDKAVQGSFTAGEDNALMNAVQTGLFPGGLTVGIAQGVREDADGKLETAYGAMVNLTAMAQKGKFKILSNIPLLAQNNREASVSIVNNIPMLKSTISGGTGTTRDVIQNIDRVDVGIKLKLTPHINPDGDVLMALNPSIEAIIDPGQLADGLAPRIAKREISTTVSVPDGKTIVLSGLIREDQTERVRKVPILGSIPLLGWLFSNKIKGVEKTNLLVFVTPHIVKSTEGARQLTESWQARTSLSTNMPPSGERVTAKGRRKNESPK